ncbi:ferredoxin reductase family protein [Agrococcus carbonis]|uniref:Predicted ferric reductase n=1 Tax=Agrococcus carbonis TaxID=684552 RepID=A0A1H1T3F0_9MICO|nr:ferredoxin reductase family protein [Agrococcus carbonis]SDS54698.1 Predicted ferric reductase [Agrococcus carbonis]
MDTTQAPPDTPAPALERAPRGARSRRLWRRAAIGVLWLTSVGVAVLWLAGGGAQELTRLPGGALASMGRMTGLVSANLLLYQVLLMARVPLFERAFGHDVLTRSHRAVGMWSFWLLVAHIVLLVLGYAADSGMQPLLQLWALVWGYPGMLLATAATLLMILVVVTSARRARARIRYESWHLLHLYAYLGVGLAIPHMLWTGTDLRTPLAAGYWWALWIAAVGSIVLWRIVLPVVRSLRHDLRVASVERDGATGVRVHVRGRDLDRLGARAGQFLIWRFLDGPGWMRGHPFSLARSPRRGELVLVARLVGDGTARLRDLRPGVRAIVEGPLGVLTGEARRTRSLLLLGAGSGVVPLLAILDEEPYGWGEATLVTRDSAPEHLLGGEHVRALVEGRGVRHVPLHGPRAGGRSSWLPSDWEGWDGADLVRSLVDVRDVDIYLCGPDAWASAVRHDLFRAGVQPGRIHQESFTS